MAPLPAASVPILHLNGHPDCPPLRREFQRILEEVRGDLLNFVIVNGDLLQIVRAQKIQSDALLVKQGNPTLVNLRQTSADVAGLNLHRDLARLERAVSQEILDESLQPLTVRVRILKCTLLAFIQWPGPSTQQQLNVAANNGERGFQLVRR